MSEWMKWRGALPYVLLQSWNFNNNALAILRCTTRLTNHQTNPTQVNQELYETIGILTSSGDGEMDERNENLNLVYYFECMVVILKFVLCFDQRVFLHLKRGCLLRSGRIYVNCC